MAPRHHGYGLSTALFLRLIKKPVLRGGYARRYVGMPALLMPVHEHHGTAAAPLCPVGTRRPQPAGHAAGDGITHAGLLGCRGGILLWQTKGLTPGEGLRRGRVAPWLLGHLPRTCRRWSLSRSGSSLPTVRALPVAGRMGLRGAGWLLQELCVLRSLSSKHSPAARQKFCCPRARF